MKVFALILILFCSYQFAYTCSCSNSSEKEQLEWLKKSDAVFQGEVISVSEPYYYFKVTKSWKGIETKTVRIEMEDSSCSLEFKLGDKPIVVAYGLPLATDMCNRGRIDSEKFDEIFGNPKIIEQPNETSSNESTESFWSTIWNKITSFFS
jgi:hypothetical protein